MSRLHIGQLLSQMGKLSQQDIHEILADQKVTHRRFGQIALAWGLCEPRHIWQAWSQQLADEPDHVDLAAVGIDAQATAYLPRQTCLRLKALPIRVLEDRFVAAVGQPITPELVRELRGLLGRDVQCVLADPAQILQAIDIYRAAPSRETNQERGAA